jgi:hypothetical protein
MALDLVTPFLRPVRSHWGLDNATASLPYPGDQLVRDPRWSWTHAVEIEAGPEEVWPWVAQIGADRGGFYSYQWLENIAGCDLRNAESIHPEWGHVVGDGLVLHPSMPAVPIVAVEPNRYLLAHAASGGAQEPSPFPEVTWLFFVEPLPGGRTRLVSRFRSGATAGRRSAASLVPYVTEAIGFVMDREMLRGIRARVARRRRQVVGSGLRNG